MTVNIDAPIIIAFTDKIRDRVVADPYIYFTEKFTGAGLIAVYGCFNVKDFFALMEHLIEHPDGMWYWVLHEGKCICSGACDPDDMEIFENYFGITQEEAKDLEIK